MSTTAKPGMRELLADLAAEQDELDAVVGRLTEAQWATATPAVGWDVRDQIAHLALVEEFARLSVTEPETFAAIEARSAADPVRFEAELCARGREMSGAEVLAMWRRERAAVLAALERFDPAARLAWFGPSMSPMSFLTARLMETWSHGQDVVDALGVVREPTPRLRHIAHLGVKTRGWSHTVHGRPVDPEPVYVELTGPGGDRWSWGDPQAPHSVRGTALDFCLVVTQRRHWTATDLQVRGTAAVEWMEIAQAFAGPPTTTAPDRGRK
mgnify:CR=1 FL=1